MQILRFKIRDHSRRKSRLLVGELAYNLRSGLESARLASRPVERDAGPSFETPTSLFTIRTVRKGSEKTVWEAPRGISRCEAVEIIKIVSAVQTRG